MKLMMWTGVFPLLGLGVTAHGQTAKTDTPLDQVALEPSHEIAGLPRVLILGDSISGGYAPPLRKLLQGRANVMKWDENCRDTNYGLTRLDFWLGTGKWDVIHFNFGLHDLKHVDGKGEMVSPTVGKQVSSKAQYEANLRKIVARLKQTGAKLVFATTTPIPAGANGRIEGNEIPYNEAAVRVMKENGIPVDDLHAFAAPRLQEIQKPANVHFTDEGSAALAKVVLASIEPHLKK